MGQDFTGSRPPPSPRHAPIGVPVVAFGGAGGLQGAALAASQELRSAGHRARAIELEFSLLLRYAGQSFELAIPEHFKDVRADFSARHQALYGWCLEKREIELVHLRVRACVRREQPPLRRPRCKRLPVGAIQGERAAELGGWRKVQVIDRQQLSPGVQFSGPALVEEFSGTTIVPPLWSARVTAGGHLWLSRG